MRAYKMSSISRHEYGVATAVTFNIVFVWGRSPYFEMKYKRIGISWYSKNSSYRYNWATKTLCETILWLCNVRPFGCFPSWAERKQYDDDRQSIATIGETCPDGLTPQELATLKEMI